MFTLGHSTYSDFIKLPLSMSCKTKCQYPKLMDPDSGEEPACVSMHVY